MKVYFQRLFSLVLVVVLCGALTVPARANIWDGVIYNLSTFWDHVTTGTSNWNLRDAIGAYTGGTWMEKYANYVDDMVTGLGTDTIGLNGYLMRLAGSYYTINNPEFVLEFVSGPPAVFGVHCKRLDYPRIFFDGAAPVTGNYLLQSVETSPVRPFDVRVLAPISGRVDVPFSMTAGDPFSVEVTFQDWGHEIRRYVVSAAFEVQPYNYSPNGFTGNFGGASSRPGNFNVRDERNIKFGIRNEDGTVIVADKIGNLMLEQENKYWNPVTNNYSIVNNWKYNYTDRRYNVEGGDGEKVSITYGDDVVTMVIEKPDGSKDTYIYSYLIAEDVEPPPVNPGPSPPPGPPPGPSPNPDDGGSNIWDFLSGIWDLLGKLVDGIASIGDTIVSGILDGLGSLLTALFSPSEEAVDKLNAEVDTKLPLIGDLQSLGDDLVSTLENPGKSVKDLRMTTVVDLGKGNGQITGAGRINLLDVSWYMEYKPLVDDVIVGFVWLVFLWNLYGALPSIIHGGASALHTTSEIRKESEYYSSWRHDE